MKTKIEKKTLGSMLVTNSIVQRVIKNRANIEEADRDQVSNIVANNVYTNFVKGEGTDAHE